MRFDGLLGNTQLKERLAAALDAGKLSHCYLITGPAGAGKRTLARLLAAAMECTGAPSPCLRCPACRKVLSGNHPDVVTVEDPDKRQTPVEHIRQARADAFVRPNEGQKKIFILPQELGGAAQNALLKILEEPPPYGVFLLLTDAPEQLLPTIRSRCQTLALTPLDPALLRGELARRCPDLDPARLDEAARQSGGFLGKALALAASETPRLPQTDRFAAAYAADDSLALMELFCSMERWKRAQFTPVLEQMQRLLADALIVRQGGPDASPAARAIAERHTAAALLDACGAVQTALDDCRANVGIAGICAGLFVRLRGAH